MEESVILAFAELLKRYDYGEISVKMICAEVPVSRTAFYRYFTDKEDVLTAFIKKEYLEKCFPVFRFHLKETGTRCFFTYIKENREIYLKLYGYDRGVLLYRCLKKAYKVGFEKRKV